jgi:hypothetical protein
MNHRGRRRRLPLERTPLHHLPIRAAGVVAVDAALDPHIEPVALVGAAGSGDEAEAGPAPSVSVCNQLSHTHDPTLWPVRHF